jgi:hypothetical protein
MDIMPKATGNFPKTEGKDPDVEEALLNQLFSIVTGQGVCVSGPMLKSKSEQLTKKLSKYHDHSELLC